MRGFSEEDVRKDQELQDAIQKAVERERRLRLLLEREQQTLASLRRQHRAHREAMKRRS